MRERLQQGTLWIAAGALFGRAANVVSGYVVARSLGPMAFGAFAVVQSSLQLFQTTSGVGLAATVTQQIAAAARSSGSALRETAQAAVVSTCVFGMLGTIALFLFAPILAREAFGAQEITYILRLASPAVLIGSLGLTLLGVISGRQAFRAIGATSLASGIVGGAAVALGAWSGGLEGACSGLVVGSLATTIFAWMALGPIRAGFLQRPDATVFRPLLARSMPIFLSTLLVTASFWTCNAIIVSGQGGFREMGLFNAANQWRTAVLFLPSLLSQVTLPVFSHGFVTTGGRAVRRTAVGICVAHAALALPAVLLFCTFSRSLMGLYGSEFSEGWPVLVLLQISVYLQIVQAPIVSFLWAVGRFWETLALNLAWAAVIISCSYASRDYGAVGAAASQASAFGVFGILLILRLARLARYEPSRVG